MAIIQKWLAPTSASALASSLPTALSECGFGSWSGGYSGATVTITNNGGDIYGATPNTFTIFWISGYQYVISYDDETEFFSIAVSFAALNHSTGRLDYWFPFVLCGGEWFAGGSATAYNELNITAANATDSSGTFKLTPLFIGTLLDFAEGLYVSQNNLCQAGVVITDGTNRFLSLGTRLFRKL